MESEIPRYEDTAEQNIAKWKQSKLNTSKAHKVQRHDDDTGEETDFINPVRLPTRNNPQELIEEYKHDDNDEEEEHDFAQLEDESEGEGYVELGEEGLEREEATRKVRSSASRRHAAIDSTAEAVKAHARELGMDPVHDIEFLWIAEEALLAELERPWVELFDQTTQKTYYYNEDTAESRWDNPVDAYYRDMYLHLKQERESNLPLVTSLSKRETRLRRELDREKSMYKQKKAAWVKREARLNRQAKKRESAFKREMEEWKSKCLALEKSHKKVTSKQISSNEAAKWEKELETTKAALIKLEEQRVKQVEELKRNNHSLEKALQQARLECELMTDKQRDLEAENKALLAQVGAQKQKKTDTESSSQAAFDKKPYLRHIKKLEHKYKKLQSELSNVRQEKESLENSLAETSATTSQTKLHLVDVERELSAVKREAYFASMEKRHLEEELITRRMSCTCSSQSSQQPSNRQQEGLATTPEDCDDGYHSDPEDTLRARRVVRGRTMAAHFAIFERQKLVLRRQITKLEEEVKLVKHDAVTLIREQFCLEC